MKSLFAALMTLLALLPWRVWAVCCDGGWPSGTQCRWTSQKMVYCCPGGGKCSESQGWCVGYWDAPSCDDSKGSGGLCFSTDATVSVKGKGVVPIMDIHLNDEVLSNADGSYSLVYAFGNRNGDRTATFTRIETPGGSIDLTPDHMLYLADKTKPVAASSVRVGDTLLLAANNTTSKRQGAVVKKVTHDITKTTGFITPVTASGTIVINGVVASSYAGKQGSEYYWKGNKFSLHYHDVSHVAVAPLRFLCTKISRSLCSSAYHHSENSQDHAGQHGFFATVHSLKHFAKSDACGPLLHALLFAAVIGTGLFFFVLDHPALVVVTVGAAYVAATAFHKGDSKDKMMMKRVKLV